MSDTIADFDNHQPQESQSTETEQNIQNDSKTIFCDLCNETFDVKSALLVHRRNVHFIKNYRCDKCSETFNFEKNLTIHKAKHFSAPAKCTECGKKYQRTSSYRGHLDTHLMDDNYVCKECDIVFEFQEYYIRHVRNVHEIQAPAEIPGTKSTFKCKTRAVAKKYSCEKCDHKFSRLSNLRRHEITHSLTKPYECSTCHQRFTQKSSLLNHIRIHSGSKPFECPKCPTSFNQRANLATHLKNVHPKNFNADEKFACRNCSCVFNKLNTLSRHNAILHRKIPTDNESDQNRSPASDEDENFAENVIEQLKSLQNDYFLCYSPDDPYRTENSENLNDGVYPNLGSLGQSENSSFTVPNKYNSATESSAQHEELVEMPSAADFTDSPKEFQESIDLSRHISTPTKETNYKCHLCERHFAIKSTLEAHILKHRKNDKVYSCAICQKLFDSLRSLDNHAQLEHAGIKIFSCNVCEKAFNSSNNLRIHKRTHLPSVNMGTKFKMKEPIVINSEEICSTIKKDAVKMFYCLTCNSKFRRSTNLRQHERSHLKLKLYSCNICQKRFSAKSSLNLHQRIHTGRKTVACEECDAKFFRIADLRRHNIFHSTVRNVVCPYCNKSFKTKDNCRQHIRSHVKNGLTVPDTLVDTNGILSNAQDQQDTDCKTENSSGNDQVENPLANSHVVGQPDNISDSELQKVESSAFTTLADKSLHECEQFDFLDESIESIPHTSENIISNLQLRTGNSVVDTFDISESLLVEPNEHVDDNLPNIIKAFELPNTEELRNEHEYIKTKVIQNKTITHKCSACVKSFKKLIDLQRHLRTHTKEKPFSCEVCSKQFALKCTLDRHKGIHDENRKMHTCQVCGKLYASKLILQTHLRIHTGERPYKCKYCTKTFRTSGHRTAHLRTHKMIKN